MYVHTCKCKFRSKEVLFALGCFIPLFLYNFCSTKQEPSSESTVNSQSQMQQGNCILALCVVSSRNPTKNTGVNKNGDLLAYGSLTHD